MIHHIEIEGYVYQVDSVKLKELTDAWAMYYQSLHNETRRNNTVWELLDEIQTTQNPICKIECKFNY